MQALDPFQLRIFKEINKSHLSENIMVSPLSIYHILSLTTNGALNKTLSEMLQALNENGIQNMNSSNQMLNKIISKLKAVNLANAVFTKFKPLESFINIIKKYHAEIKTLESADQVNMWCKEKTNDKIPKILDSLDPDDLMVLINAIYFQGKWEKSFDKRATMKNKFMNLNKTPIEVLFMNKTDHFIYCENNEVQAISLNYKGLDKLEALIILPKNGKENDINNYINDLTLEKYSNIIQKLSNHKVSLRLPKFEINFGDELTPYFNKLGMIQAFTDSADFSGMSKANDLKIGKIIHKTFIKVDEEGTEAAAVTAVVMKKRAMMPRPEKIIDMIVDHPFLFIIRSNGLPKEHDILFISKVECL